MKLTKRLYICIICGIRAFYFSGGMLPKSCPEHRREYKALAAKNRRLKNSEIKEVLSPQITNPNYEPSNNQLKANFRDLVSAHSPKDTLFVVDCGIPIEARWLEDCGIKIYPLHELATALFMIGEDPTKIVDTAKNS